ncbi:hypothetical protein D9619_010112 [Psilocybe cf. subviscida]|uniref:Uncharacterized protein n=1 Tax=Psilocybe cf. subviscida TaxID=2480587 RepID=A0A8H5F6L7_9AGAR|nr:hypothetical protein D9619_010112 [Psilocybe cf. subviscida]
MAKGLTAVLGVNHLYIEHGFPLIECTCKDESHDHSRLDWILANEPGTTVYFADTLEWFKRYGRTPT